MAVFVQELSPPSPEGRAAVRANARKGERLVGPYWAVFRDGTLVRFETAGGHLVHQVGSGPVDVNDVVKPEGYEDILDLILGKE